MSTAQSRLLQIDLLANINSLFRFFAHNISGILSAINLRSVDISLFFLLLLCNSWSVFFKSVISKKIAVMNPLFVELNCTLYHLFNSLL